MAGTENLSNFFSMSNPNHNKKLQLQTDFIQQKASDTHIYDSRVVSVHLDAGERCFYSFFVLDLKVVQYRLEIILHQQAGVTQVTG